MYAVHLKTPSAGGAYTVSTPKSGMVTLTDIGSKKVAGLPKESWGVLINKGTQAWVAGYEGGGEITLVFDEAGNMVPESNFSVTPVSYTQ